MEKYKIVFTKEELEVLGQLIDAGVRAQGLAAVKHAAFMVSKIEKAEQLEEKTEE